MCKFCENNSFQNSVYLPDLTDYTNFLGGGTPGNYYSASAPNIVGKIRSNAHGGYGGGVVALGDPKGCFTSDDTSYRVAITNQTGGYYSGNYGFKLDTSIISSIYGRSSYLYPNHYGVEYWIKYK